MGRAIHYQRTALVKALRIKYKPSGLVTVTTPAALILTESHTHDGESLHQVSLTVHALT